jgi:hypothetical protein
MVSVVLGHERSASLGSVTQSFRLSEDTAVVLQRSSYCMNWQKNWCCPHDDGVTNILNTRAMGSWKLPLRFQRMAWEAGQ